MCKKIMLSVLMLSGCLLLMAHSNAIRDWVFYGIIVDDDAIVTPVSPHDKLRFVQDAADGSNPTVDIQWDKSKRTIQWSAGSIMVQAGDDAADLGSDSATDGYVLTADGAGGSAWEAIPAGSGDVTDVGDCSTGACFTADGTGTQLWFEGSTADGWEAILTSADCSGADATITLPCTTGNAVTTGDTGTVTDTMLADNYSGTGACGAGQYVHTLNSDAAPTCSTPTDTNTMSAVVMLTRDSLGSTSSASYVTMAYGAYPGFSNFSSETHTAYCRVWKSAGAGTCSCRLYDATAASNIAEVTAVSSGSTTNLANMGTVTEPAGWAAITAGIKSSDGATACGFAGITWMIEE